MSDNNRFPMKRKPYSDGTLKHMTKRTLIEYIRCMEHNYENLYLAYNVVVDANLERFKDFERVIRCKDCKNWVCGFIDDQDNFIPPHCGKYQQKVGHSADDHCSLAERKEE